MKVSEVMTRNVRLASPSDPLRHIAKLMATDDIGFMPVGDEDRLVGTITDRDMVVRALAIGKGADCRVSEVMSHDVKYCFDDEDVEHVIANMGDLQVRRLPVVNRDKRLVGVVSLADAALNESPTGVGLALAGVVEPSAPH